MNITILKILLKKLENDKSIGIVKMETMRFEFPKNNFLKKIQKIIKEKNLIFIIDECTTGFRENFGGLYSKYKIEARFSDLWKITWKWLRYYCSFR